MSGLMIFPSVRDAIRAGYEVPRPAVPDSEGLLLVRIKTNAGWAMALCRVGAAA